MGTSQRQFLTRWLSSWVEVGEGDGSHSRRGWKRRIQQTITVHDLYYAEMPFPDGEAKHPFRLPSVKARELWKRNSEYFHLSLEHVLGSVESSGNWKRHPLLKQAGLQAVPMTFYGDAAQYVVNKFGKQDSLVCLYF